MTKATFDKLMLLSGDCFKDDSACKLQLEIIKKIVNCRAIPDFEKLTMVNQYTKNLATNKCIVEGIKEYNKR